MANIWLVIGMFPLAMLAAMRGCRGEDYFVVTSLNAEQEVCPLSNGPEIMNQLQEYNRSKDGVALKHGLEELLDHDSKAYEQLQNLWNISQPMYSVGKAALKELAEVFVLCGGAVNFADSDQYTMLDGAALWGQLGLVIWLAGHGVDIQTPGNNGNTPLMYATVNDHLDIVQYLIQYGAITDITNNNGLTALDIAEISNFHDIVLYLIHYPH